MSNTLAFKCYLSANGSQDNEIRRFTLESDVVGNFTYLKEKVRSIYPQLLRDNFSLMYIDEEGDKITISSDDELVSALMYAKRKENEPFRLIIQGSSKSAPSAAAAPSSDGNCQGEIHFGVTCDGCQGGVRGFRYKCMQCPDYDLCGKCEAAGQHPGHTFIRVNGPMPTCLPALRNLLIAGGGHEMPHWRRRHHGRSGHWNPHHHGRWNAWCPSGINVEVDPPCGSGSENTKEEKEKPSSCPFKSNMEHAREQAKQAAQAFQANGPEFLQNIGTTLAAMLEQFGIDTQVDVHGPETGGKCPREAAKKQEQSEAKAEPEKAKEEVIIPIVVEKKEEKQPKEVIIPITIMKDEAAPVVTSSPYAEIAAEVAAAKETSTEASRTNSPTRETDDWTMVGDVAAAAASAELGARPKSPQKLIESVTAPLHPDPLVAGALETMLAMGFTNEGGWLSQLLEVKGGDIGKALDVLQARVQRQ